MIDLNDVSDEDRNNGITEVDRFISEWNDMPAYNERAISGIYVFTHGNDRALIFEDGSSTNAISINGRNRAGEAIHALTELNEVELHGVVSLFSCNAGHLETYASLPDGNLASALSLRITGNSSVIGYDGNVGFGNFLTARGLSDDYTPRLSNDQEGYYDILATRGARRRPPRGSVQYKDGVINNAYVPGMFTWGAA